MSSDGGDFTQSAAEAISHGLPTAPVPEPLDEGPTSELTHRATTGQLLALEVTADGETVADAENEAVAENEGPAFDFTPAGSLRLGLADPVQPESSGADPSSALNVAAPPAATQLVAEQSSFPAPTPSPPAATTTTTAVETVGDDDIPPVRRPLLRGAALRDQLLEKAASVGRARPAPPPKQDGLDELMTDQPPATSHRDVELDRIGSVPESSSAAPLVPGVGKQLSPRAIAIFGAIFGLAAVASINAVLVQCAPRGQIRVAPTPVASGPVPSGSPVPATSVAKKERKKIAGPWRVSDSSGGKIVKGVIGREPFLKAIQDAGIEKSQAYRVLGALKDLRDLNKCNRSDKFVAVIDRKSKAVKGFEYIVSKEEIYQAKENESGSLVGKKLDLKVTAARTTGAMAYEGGSFDKSAQKYGLESGLAEVVDKALDGHISIQEMKKGSRLRLIAQEVTVLGEFARYAGIEAIEYQAPGSEPLRVYYYKKGSSKGYYDHRGRAPYSGGWRKPVKGPRTSPFNPKRMHPVLKKVMPHNGTDFGAPMGAEVWASSYGTIAFIGNAGASGNLVKISHSGGIETGYAHLSRFAKGLKVGDKVSRLQLIGYVGSTGRSTGPHLHFTAKKNGKFFDAEKLNLDSMRVMPPSERDAFAKFKAKYDALLDAIKLPQLETQASSSDGSSGDSSADDPPAENTPPPPPVETKPSGDDKPAPASGDGPAPVHLSDEDLLKQQPLNDDGEVDG